MSILGEQVLLRAHLQSADRAPFTPTFQRLVRAARSEGLAGATVLRGLLGLGHRGLIRRSFLSLVGHVPIIVEIVDRPERIGRFIDETLSRIVDHGLVTLERARVMMYRHRESDSPDRLDLGGLLAPLSTVPTLMQSATMQINEQGVLLRVFLGDSDKFERRWLYEAIVYKAKELGLAGATVLRGVEGFGAHSVVHTSGLVEMSTDLPIVVEIIDTEEKVRTLLPHLETMVREGMITMERVMILMFRRDAEKKGTSQTDPR
jgi:hypothetical protein